jgi:hypothetical protein
MSKRVKVEDLEGWLFLFCTSTIMEKVARHLPTPDLFRLLLGVSKVLRNKALSPSAPASWNRALEYKRRVFHLCGMVYADINVNVLRKFIQRLYRKRVCSLCFRQQYTEKDVLFPRYRARGLKVCIYCATHRRKASVASPMQLAFSYLWEPGQYLFLSEGVPRLDEMDSFRPLIYHESQLCFYEKHAIYTVPVVGFDGECRIVSFGIRN